VDITAKHSATETAQRSSWRRRINSATDSWTKALVRLGGV